MQDRTKTFLCVAARVPFHNLHTWESVIILIKIFSIIRNFWLCRAKICQLPTRREGGCVFCAVLLLLLLSCRLLWHVAMETLFAHLQRTGGDLQPFQWRRKSNRASQLYPPLSCFSNFALPLSYTLRPPCYRTRQHILIQPQVVYRQATISTVCRELCLRLQIGSFREGDPFYPFRLGRFLLHQQIGKQDRFDRNGKRRERE